ncbi:MAG TPA: NHL repeat-containing protein [Gaiellaceae bacterium]|nr:NHL repeat-containing protein [Gaiellaceae bacterium]
MRRILAFGLLVALVVPLQAAAAGHVQTLISFDPATEHPEGLAVSKTGDILLSMTSTGELRKISPDGTQSTLATLPAVPGFGPLGLAVDAPGNVYAAVVTNDPATHGVYRVAPDGGFTRLPGTAAIEFPNGVALDKRGNLYVTDTVGAAVWRIPRGGEAEPWAEHELLAGDRSFGFPFPIGANGIAYDHGSLVVAVSEGARLVRIPILPDGSAGDVEVLAEHGLLYGADGLALDVHGNVYVAVIVQSSVVRVSGGGGPPEVLATAANGLDFTSSLAFGTGKGDRKAAFLVNFAIGPPGGAGPALLRMNVGVPGAPQP